MQASGHGREAVNLARMAREAGYDLSLVHGIFVDMAIKAGGWTRACSDIIPGYSGSPPSCIALPDDLEKGAELITATQPLPKFGKMACLSIGNCSERRRCRL